MEEVEMDMKVPRPGSTGRERVGGGLTAVAVVVVLLLPSCCHNRGRDD